MPLIRLRERLKANALGWLLLRSLALAYGAAVVSRRFLYETLLPRKRLSAKVISIGNLTTGGTGKTPASLLAARTMRERGAQVAILSRGYGRQAKGRRITTLAGEEAPSWRLCGDEPWMMHQALRGEGIPILVCADRAGAGREAIAFHGSQVLILDDGFQHLRLARDLEVVLVSALDPFGGAGLLPLGNLREPLRTLSRADLVLLTHADRVSEAELWALRDRLRSLSPAPILEAAHRPDFLLELPGQRRLSPDSLSGQEVVCLSGIADWVSFEGLLPGLGVRIAQRWRYPDHHPYTPGELGSLERLRAGRPVVTTLKDFTRLPPGWEEILAPRVCALAIRLEILKGKELWTEALSRLIG